MPKERTSHVTERDAEKFLNKLKTTVSPKKYWIFMSLIQETKDERTDIVLVVTKVTELFRRNGELLSEFNYFVSRGYKIVPLMMPEQFQIRVKRSVDFLQK